MNSFDLRGKSYSEVHFPVVSFYLNLLTSHRKLGQIGIRKSHDSDPPGIE